MTPWKILFILEKSLFYLSTDKSFKFRCQMLFKPGYFKWVYTRQQTDNQLQLEKLIKWKGGQKGYISFTLAEYAA